MTDKEKAEMFDKIQEHLWNMARYGHLLQSTYAAAMIRTLEIPGPNGEDPEDA